MSEEQQLSLDETMNLLRVAGESTRLRLLALLAQSDLTVSDLVQILGQSQPRISRHLKLLMQSGLLERHQEGSWAYFRLSDKSAGSQLIQVIINQFDGTEGSLLKDRQRLEQKREEHARLAADYFTTSSSQWDKIRALHVDEDLVESTMLKMVGPVRVKSMLDLGTGTGRVLELFAGVYEQGIGIDSNRQMLSLARARLDGANLSRVQTRQGDMNMLPHQNSSYDLITIHQVLHYLDNPASAIEEAAKVLSKEGRMLIVDFAPHQLEFLRDEHAHLRLGISNRDMKAWLRGAGLKLLDFKMLESESTNANLRNEKAKDALTVSLWLSQKG